MKIALYDDSDNVLDVYEGVNGAKVNGDSIEWEAGELHGVKCNFAFLPDDVTINIGEIITQEIKNETVSGNFKPFEEKVNEAVANLQTMINFILLNK